MFVLRPVGTLPWTPMDTHNNKTSYKLTVLKPDTTYQVKVLTQCLSKLHKTNEAITVRTPEGCEYHVIALHQVPTAALTSAHFNLNLDVFALSGALLVSQMQC